jgi:3-oxoacyl-[acyl-carrier-protein] synthase-3
MQADFEGILTNGLGLAAETWKAFQQELTWENQDVDKVFSHQVSAIHQEMVFRTLELNKSKGFATVQYLGNVGACSLPISAAIGIEEGHLKAGDKATMLGIGSGLSCIMLGMEW